MGKFILIDGKHVERDGKKVIEYAPGEIIVSDTDLQGAFVNKFAKIDEDEPYAPWVLMLVEDPKAKEPRLLLADWLQERDQWDLGQKVREGMPLTEILVAIARIQRREQ